MKSTAFIKRYQKIMRKEMKRQGFVFGSDKDAIAILRSAFFHVAFVLRDELASVPIVILAVYDTEDQTATEAQIADAIIYYTATTDGKKKLFGLAVSYNAICMGLDYCYFVIMHELAHSLVSMKTNPEDVYMPHDPVFETTLNQLLDRFNKATGRHIKNDYSGYGQKTR